MVMAGPGRWHWFRRFMVSKLPDLNNLKLRCISARFPFDFGTFGCTGCALLNVRGNLALRINWFLHPDLRSDTIITWRRGSPYQQHFELETAATKLANLRCHHDACDTHPPGR